MLNVRGILSRISREMLESRSASLKVSTATSPYSIKAWRAQLFVFGQQSRMITSLRSVGSFLLPAAANASWITGMEESSRINLLRYPGNSGSLTSPMRRAASIRPAAPSVPGFAIILRKVAMATSRISASPWCSRHSIADLWTRGSGLSR